MTICLLSTHPGRRTSCMPHSWRSRPAVLSVLLSLTATLAADAPPPQAGLRLLPWPKSIRIESGEMPLTSDSRIVAGDAQLRALAAILAEDIYRAIGLRLKTSEGAGRTGDVVLAFDPSIKGDEEYALDVADKAVCRGRTAQAVSWATVTLVQALPRDGRKAALPRMTVADEPDIRFRSAECDIARKFHPVENLYELIDLFRFYKVRYIMFHMNDHGLFTFGSEKFPGLPTPVRHYTLAELRDLVSYAEARGVGIIPEIEMPGHSDAPRLMPAVFGGVDRKTGKATPTGYVNIFREDTILACEELLSEAMDVFTNAPYVSIGADEVGSLNNYPNAGEFQAQHPKTEVLQYFIGRMNDLVKKRGKRLLVYGRGGPPDVIQMPWSGNQDVLARQGYDLVIYTTGSVTQHLITFHKPPYNDIMLYTGFTDDVYRWDRSKPKDRRDAEAVKRLYGIHILTWQNWHFNHFRDLRRTMAAVAENAWNQSRVAQFRPFDEWKKEIWSCADQRLDDLVFPVKIEAEGLLDPGDIVFHQAMTVRLSSKLPGTIRYRVEKLDYFKPPALPTKDSPAYTGPIMLTEPAFLYAALFDEKDNRIAWGTERHYWPINPVVRCTAYARGDVEEAMRKRPEPAAAGKPDPAAAILDGVQRQAAPAALGLQPTATFPLGRLTFNPSHRDVYCHSSLLILDGQLKIAAGGEYRFQSMVKEAEILVDGKSVAFGGSKAWPAYSHALHLDAGLHAFRMIGTTCQKAPGMATCRGPDGKVQPVDAWLVLLPAYRRPIVAQAVGVLAPDSKAMPTHREGDAAPPLPFAPAVTLSLKPEAAGQTVRYTLDGSPPTPNSPACQAPIRLEDSSTVLARCFDAGGKPAGALWQERYELCPFVVRARGTARADDSRFGEAAQLAFTPTVSYGNIRYTLDGSAPTAQSPAAEGPLELRRTTTVTARLFDEAGRGRGYTWQRTFRQTDCEPDNLTCGKPSASKDQQERFPPGLANDGIVDLSEYWGSGPAPQWWQVDLEKVHTLGRIRVWPYWDGRRYYQYTVEISEDGRSWTQVADMSRNTTPHTAAGDEHRFKPTPARYIKVTMTRNSANPIMHLVEVRAYEPRQEAAAGAAPQ